MRPASAATVLAQFKALQQNFLHAGGWYECRDANGKVSRFDMPSTTPYHLATCLEGLQRQL
ncbi:N-acylglucosamine 2-epimerase [compost metagenome]